jgi:Ca2+-binding RTX toxin-like protein
VPRRVALISLSLLVLLLAPAAAHAATAGQGPGSTMSVTAGGEQNNVTVTFSGGAYTISDSAGMTPGPGCGTIDANTVGCGDNFNSLTVEMGAGNDTFSSAAIPDAVTADGGAGDDRLGAGSAADTLRGGEGQDDLRGSAGSDSLSGGPGDDTLGTGAGPEGGEPDADRLSGEDGVDTVTYANRPGPMTVTVDDVANDGLQGEGDNVVPDVERVVGSDGADSITGGAGAETLEGGPGADALAGGAGPDALRAGGDDDTVNGGDGDDDVSGGAGSDTAFGGPGNDLLDGSVPALVGVDGADVLDGGEGDDSVAGGDGDDTLSGGPGADSMAGGLGTDTATYEAPAAAPRRVPGVSAAGAPADLNVTLDGLADDGTIGEGDNVGADVENVNGAGGDDTFTGAPGANGLRMAGGEDYADGAGGSDALDGGDGRDVLRMRDGTADTVNCGAGVDFAILDKNDTAPTACERVDTARTHRALLAKRVVLRPLRRRGEQFRIAGSRRFVPLKDTLGLPLGSRVNATLGQVRLTSARGRRGSQSAVLSRGAFLVKQPRTRFGLTEMRLTGGDLSKCSTSKAGAAGTSRATFRRLFGRARGRFRTRGRHSTATVRGTTWEVRDRCDGTLTRVIRGRVTVRDLVRKKTIRLRSGQSYLARRGHG